MTLTDKVAVVTGGTRGIGLAVASALLQEGAIVAICGRNEQELSDVNRMLGKTYPGKVIAARCDVGVLDDVRQFVATVEQAANGIDILVNNAGIGITKAFEDMTPEDWYSTIDINLTGVFHFCHCIVPSMKRRGGGDIINVSSRSGRNAHPGGAAYCTSKFGLNGFSEVLQLDLRKHRIRVSYIMPGRVSTDFAGETPEEWHIAPEDVAQSIVSALKLPKRTLAGRIELRPSFPPV